MLRRRRTGPGLLHSPRPRGHGAHGTVFTVFWMAALAVGGSPTPAADKGLFDEPEAFQVFAERSPVDCLEFIETHREGLTTARHRIHAEIFASIAHRTLGAHAASLEAATRAARLARTDGDVPLRLRAKHAHAAAVYLHGRVDEAAGIVDAALTLADFHLLEAEKTGLLNLVGIINWRRGNLPRALEAFEESARINRIHGSPRHLHANLSNIGMTLYRMGEHERSIEAYEEALAVIDGLDLPIQRAAVLSNLGESYAALGNTRRARELILESLDLEREIGNEKNIAITIFVLGKIASQENDWERARALYEEALRMQRRSGADWDTATTIQHMARDLVAQGLHGEALEVMAEGFAVAKAVFSKTLLREFHDIRAKALAGTGETEPARYHAHLADHFDMLARNGAMDGNPEDSPQTDPPATGKSDGTKPGEKSTGIGRIDPLEGMIAVLLLAGTLALIASNRRLRRQLEEVTKLAHRD